MPKYNYCRYKIRIAPDSEKKQGLVLGDIVRRQYADKNRMVYSLMVVLETGEERIETPEGISFSPYFIGALLDGDDPCDGELLDFVRVSNFFDEDRSGALYLTSSDSEAPYMDAIDGVGTASSLCRPSAGGGNEDVKESDRYCCTTAYFLSEYKPEEDGIRRIFRMVRNEAVEENGLKAGLVQNLKAKIGHPQRVVISYRIRASKPLSGIPLILEYTGGGSIDGQDTVDVSTQWQYKLNVITTDYPAYFRTVWLDLSGMLETGDWVEVAELNICLLSDIASFSKATRVRVGKISGVVDPLFGVLDGYGAYFQNLYATKNVSVAGTLTAGDQDGFASTFYVGRIHRNCFLNSLYPKFTTMAIPGAIKPPAGIGSMYLLPIGCSALECQSEDWALEHNGEQYCFSFWAYATSAHTITLEHGGEVVGKLHIGTEWERHYLNLRITHIADEPLRINLTGSETFFFASPQLEVGRKPTLYQPTDEVLTETDEYGAWLCRGGIGGTIQNPLLRLEADGSIRSANGSFVINADGTGHFAGGKFKWDQEHIELKELDIDWESVAEYIPKPISVRSLITSNQPLTQVYYWETNSTVPNWALAPNLVLTPSLLVSTFGQVDQITAVAEEGTPGIKSDSVVWYKGDKIVISGKDQATIADASGKYALTIKANLIGTWSPQMTFAFTAIYVDIHGQENPIRAELQFTLMSAPSSAITAVMYTPDGVVFRGGEPETLRLHCDMWRGININDTKVSYVWGVPDESVYANTQVAEATSAGVTQIKVRSTANMVPGTQIKIISTLYTITAVDHGAGTVSFTPATKGSLSVNAIVICPRYNSMLGAGWIILNENDPRGTLSGWDTNELVLSPAAVNGGETFKCAIRDNDTNPSNPSKGKVVSAMASVSDVTLPDISALEWISDWDSNKTHIGAEVVVTPKIFTGVKHDDGLLTGVALGRFPITMHDDTDTDLTVRNIDGICGFDHGRNVFSIESSGNVSLGFGGQIIRYNASTGQIEFGAGVSLNWISAISQAKTETLNSAAATAQTKADTALNSAKGYADTQKDEAIAAAGQDTDSKIHTLSTAIEVSIADAKKAGTDARAVADAITAQANGEDWSSKLTYIDAHGIFTGRLSAATVNALQINASQITAGVIDTARLNVDDLKASILTASNIEALELNVVKGKIGGWSIDKDSIYMGVKKNTVTAFTDKLYDMTIGTMGIRGRKWRFDSIGSGAIAGGNIWWDIAGKVYFKESVSVEWQRGIDTASELARAMAFGKMLYRDPTFSKGLNGILLYDSTDGGHVTLTRQNDSEAPNDSKYITRIVNTGEAAPYCGGFTWRTSSAASKVFIVRLIARIPAERQITFATNDIGTDGTHRWLTSQQGTGQWQEYVCKVICGNSGIFSATNYFTVTGDFGTPSVPFVWDMCYATVFDVTSAEKYTTTIDANGIYTGILTAGQITTGILSADRIAAGSIKAEKLDAASIKASIINTDYINGLSLNFTTGTIGGWTIGADSINSGMIGQAGAMPIQIRAQSAGAGYWSTGDYRPYGITMTWLQSNNAGHIVLGQIAATGNMVKTGFIGLQMMSWVGEEYFCLSVDTAHQGSRSVYNRIAGWGFDHRQIWKNNVSLGADGSIVNTTKWQLNNDGSGRVASGNIAWDINGNVTFGSSVSVRWESGISAAKELAQAMAFGRMLYRVPEFYANGSINYNGTVNYCTNAVRSIETVAGCPNNTGYALKYVATAWSSPGDMRVGGFYFGNQSRANAVYVVRLIAKIPAGRSIQNYHNQYGTGGVTKWLTPNTGTDKWEEYICKVTCGESGNFSTINHFALTGGVAPTAAAPVIWYIAYATVFDVTSSEKYTTTIDANGIYTGTLTASQVNAVAINAGSITVGTLSANRLAAGSIKAEKLDAASIKASIINTDYINGLSCTFVRGKIGGWTIGASTITGNHLVLDSANKRIAVFDGASSQISGKRVQLYYNDDTNFGFYATDATGNCIARLGSQNTIAGWNINTNSIYKNSVSLGADGSIINSTKWQLKNDGSGRVASGNIAWDAAGNVTFGASVALNWANAGVQGKIYVRGTGWHHPAARMVKVGGTIIVNDTFRSMALTLLNRSTLTLISHTHYDTYGSDANCNALAAALDGLTSDKIIVLTSYDAIRINSTLNTAIQRCGGSNIVIPDNRIPYVLIGIPGIGKDNGLLSIMGTGTGDPFAEIVTTVTDGMPEGMNCSANRNTYIDGNGIYTGSISANQIRVDSALVVGGSSYNGYISVRDASNNVKVTLNRSGITAVGGTIGGWSLNSSQIYSGPVILSSGGSITNNNRWRLNADGSGQLAGGNLIWDTAGNLTATGGHFKDVTIQGTIRSAFVLNDPSIWIGGSDSSQVDPRHYDNVVVVRGSWNENINLQWTLDQSGRKICLLNYMWRGSVTVGYMDISAPSGKWFYEDGIQKRTITFSRELIELLGYGDDQTFYGWIVINRRDIMCDGKYGQFQQVLAQGTVTCNSNTSASIKYKTFDGTTMSVTKSGTGNFYVYMPWALGADKYMVMLTGKTCVVQNTMIYASVRNQYSSYFQVSTQDDASLNEGSFNFQIISTADFK